MNKKSSKSSDMLPSFKRPTSGIRFRFAIICLLAFLARFSVALGHDCDKVNVFLTLNDKVSESSEQHQHQNVSGDVSVISAHQCEDNKEQEKHHDHETCPVCSKYEELQKDSFYNHYFSIAIFPQNIFISVISGHESLNLCEKKYTPLPRAPPIA